MFMIKPGADSYYSFLGIGPDATPAEVRDARTKLNNQLVARERATRDPQDLKSIEKRRQEINSKSGILASPEKRAKYDSKNAGLFVFTVKVAAAPLFCEQADQLYVLYHAARRFLAERGDALPPLCDLDREDFRADFTPCQLLEQLMKEAAHGAKDRG
jgi:curved DNA-binding protein CbpA